MFNLHDVVEPRSRSSRSARLLARQALNNLIASVHFSTVWMQLSFVWNDVCDEDDDMVWVRSLERLAPGFDGVELVD